MGAYHTLSDVMSDYASQEVKIARKGQRQDSSEIKEINEHNTALYKYTSMYTIKRLQVGLTVKFGEKKTPSLH